MVNKRNKRDKYISTYVAGMNQDLSPRLYDNKHYLEAKWFTPVLNEEGQIGALTNPKGTVATNIILQAGFVVIGETKFRDLQIIISANITGTTYIYKYNPTTDTLTSLYTDTSLDSEDKLGYTSNMKLDIVSRYENEQIQKIYFSDNGKTQPLRYANIATDLTGMTQSDFNIIPSVNLSKVSFEGYTGGNLQTGMITYSYQQYKRYGAETSFSETCKIIPISSTIEKTTLKNIKGSDIGENTGVGIQLSIANLDINYERIRIIGIQYTDRNSPPTIRIIYEGESFGSTMSIIDNGSSLGDYDVSTFRLLNQFSIKPGYLTTKNNILFAGNITEEYFDLDQYLIDEGQTSILTTDVDDPSIKFWDSRVFRYDSFHRILIFNSDGSFEWILASAYDTISYTHDCINNYNLVSKNNPYDLNPDLALKWNSDGTKVGGSGKNIELTIATKSGSTSESWIGYEIDGDKQPQEREISYQRDEIYRQAIQFEDYLGRKSFPKWMLDIRIPNHGDDDVGDVGDTYRGAFWFLKDEEIQARSIFPSYEINNVPKNPDGSYMKWRILRTKREGYDKTVLGTALIVPIIKGNDDDSSHDFSHDNTTTHYNMSRATYANISIYAALADVVGGFPNGNFNHTIDGKFVEIICPEIVFNKIDISNCKLQVVGTVQGGDVFRDGDWRDAGAQNWENTDNPAKEDSSQRVQKMYLYNALDSNLNSTWANIDDYKVIEPKAADQSVHSIGGNAYRHMGWLSRPGDGLENDQWSEHGTCGIATLDRKFGVTSSDGIGIMFALVKKDSIPYGGNTFVARANNQYIPSGEFVDGTSNESATSHIAEYGDTHIAFFDYMRHQFANEPVQQDGNNQFQEIIYIPVETQINLKMRNDDSFSKISDSPFYTNIKLREEGTADVTTGITVANLYRYNPVYSRDNDVELYKPLVYDANNNYEYDHRVRRSQVKYDGEYSDSWLKFLEADRIDVDAQYGQLIKLDVYNNKLLYFQETGFGTLPVGEKELIPSDGTSLALGSSGILNRYDYLSDKIGSNTKEGILISNNAIYIYSNSLNTIYRYNQGPEPISDIKGLNSWFDKNVVPSSIVISGYNPLLSEVIFGFDEKLLVFNELSGIYVYHYPDELTSGISRFVTHNNNMYSFSNHTSNVYGHQHNVGDRNSIHDIDCTSSITLIVNPKGTEMNVFDVLELITEKYDTNEAELFTTFDSIRIYNDYQDTGIIPLIVGTNIKQRFRTWRFAKIRDVGSRSPHFKSTFIKVVLNIKPTINEQIILHNLTTNFSSSKLQT